MNRNYTLRLRKRDDILKFTSVVSEIYIRSGKSPAIIKVTRMVCVTPM